MPTAPPSTPTTLAHRTRIARVALLIVVASCAAASELAPATRQRAGQTAVDVPVWVEALIDSLAAEPVANPPLSVTRYAYRGDFVFYVPAHCCDIESVAFTASGEVLCRPDGGLTGAGDGRCADFFAERRSATLIWRDPRTSAP